MAQSKKEPEVDSLQFCDPSLKGGLRPKFFEVSKTGSYFYKAKANNYLTNSEETNRVVSNQVLEAKLKFPLFLSPGFMVLGGLGYSSEEYIFENTLKKDRENPSFFNNMNQQTLKGLSGKLYATKSFKSNKFIFTSVGIRYQGDFHLTHSPFNSYLNYDAGFLYGWKRSDDFVMGTGLAVSNSFGRFNVYPLLAYQRNFSEGLGVDALLPKSLKLRYTTNDKKNNVYLLTEVNGANYRVNDFEKLPGATGPVVWQNANLEFKLGYEREIHDWLWFSIEAGARQNLRSRLIYPGTGGGTESVLDCSLKQSVVFKAGLFFVVPQKFIK